MAEKASVIKDSGDTRASLERPTQFTQADSDAIDSHIDAVLGKDDSAPPTKIEPAEKPMTVKAVEPNPVSPSSTTLSSTTGEKKATVIPAQKPPTPKTEAKPVETPPPAEPLATPPANVEPVTPAPVAKPFEPVDPEIDAIEKPRGLSPKNDGNWDALRGVAKREKIARLAAEAKAKTLESTQGKLPEPVQKELTELREMRRVFSLQDDPHFKEQFDAPMAETNEKIFGLLANFGVSQDVMNDMKARGGPNGYTDDWWEEQIFKPLKESGDPRDKTAAVLLRNMLDKNVQLAFDREQELSKASKGKVQWLKDRETKEAQSVEQEKNFYAQQLNAVQKQFPWANPVEIPPDATPEQKAQGEAHNQFYEATVNRVRMALDPKAPPQVKLETAIAAAGFFRIREDYKELEQRNKVLAEELAQMKQAGVTRTAGIATPPAGTKKKSSLGERIMMRDEDAVDALMNEVGA